MSCERSSMLIKCGGCIIDKCKVDSFNSGINSSKKAILDRRRSSVSATKLSIATLQHNDNSNT
jgi:hypothetical protein